MRVLAFDTSSQRASAAVLDGDSLVARQEADVARHGKALEPLLRAVLDAAGLAPADLDLVAVGLGPGSFTGTRIGMAAAKGLAFGCGIPLVGVGSLEVLAAGVGDSGRVAPLVDAGRGRVYGALYELGTGRPVTRLEPFDLPPDEAVSRVQGARVVGNGILRHEAITGDASDGERTPDAEVLGRLALLRHAAGEIAPPGLEPIYVRSSDAKLPARALTTQLSTKPS
ncbi:MAG: tRNA (adenosine(37)-N6)-threonylcarbamoyltransferase complex dimerization subunit type 1 TsaB [Deltaproteobacteria bacterium]|nr:tRNA (adenosine(37)-N6)-threonylcarbamoyltransferase complex dimerization subunit type 1 TsaB [Deltaproteobacteria bacterium]